MYCVNIKECRKIAALFKTFLWGRTKTVLPFFQMRATPLSRAALETAAATAGAMRGSNALGII